MSQQGSQYQHVTCQHHCLDMHDRANVNTVQSREYSNRLAPDARHFHTTHASVDMPSRAFTNSKIMPVRVDLYLRAYLQNMNVYMSTAPIHSRTYTCLCDADWVHYRTIQRLPSGGGMTLHSHPLQAASITLQIRKPLPLPQEFFHAARHLTNRG